MRKSISFYLLPFLFIVLCLSSCSKTEKKTEYTHAIPANATEVAALDLTSIVDKAGLNNSDTQATLQKLLGLLLEYVNRSAPVYSTFGGIFQKRFHFFFQVGVSAFEKQA